MKKPVLVIVLVVAWILIGINSFRVGMSWLVTSLDIMQPTLNTIKTLKLGEGILDKSHIMTEIICKYPVFSGIIIMVTGLFCIISSFYLLRLRAWARLALEIISWAWLPQAIIALAQSISLWKLFTPIREELKISPIGMSEFVIMDSQITGVLIGSVFSLSLAVLMIILLRRKSVREAVKAEPGAYNPGTCTY